MHTIVLLEPEIPPNTGTIARLCVVSSTQLHLVGSLGFELTDKYLKRASMDYWKNLNYTLYPDFDAYVDTIDFKKSFLFSTKGANLYTSMTYPRESVLFFGNETSGTPQKIQARFESKSRVCRIPMQKHQRSINLALSVGIVLYEVLRQNQFEGLV